MASSGDFTEHGSPNNGVSSVPSFYSAPSSPIHSLSLKPPPAGDSSGFEFSNRPSLSSGADAGDDAAMSSAEDLFLNGQIRPLSLSSAFLPPSPPCHSGERGRDLSRSTCRRARSMSPVRKERGKSEAGAPAAAISSSASGGRGSSRRWEFLKEFLHRSKSEGRGRTGGVAATPLKEKRNVGEVAGRRKSPHELHYRAKRAEAEGMKRKTYLPYRQGVLGCLGFSWRSYGAINGFTRAMNTTTVFSS